MWRHSAREGERALHDTLACMDRICLWCISNDRFLEYGFHETFSPKQRSRLKKWTNSCESNWTFLWYIIFQRTQIYIGPGVKFSNELMSILYEAFKNEVLKTTVELQKEHGNEDKCITCTLHPALTAVSDCFKQVREVIFWSRQPMKCREPSEHF